MDNRRIIGEASNASILGRGIRCLIQVHEDGMRKKQRERVTEGSRMSMLDPARCAIEQNFARAMLAVAGEGGEMLPRHGVFVQAIGTDHVRRAHHVGEPPDGGSWC